MAKGRNATNLISLKDNNEDTVYESKRINDIMKQFYLKLYSFECITSDDLRKTFMDQTSLPSLTEEQELLKKPITREEVLVAIRLMAMGHSITKR